jgi:hypothetical protein
MWITQDEAVVMFARYCRARFGKPACEQVRAKAHALKMRGDMEGHDVWNKVADEIDRTHKHKSSPRAVN